MPDPTHPHKYLPYADGATVDVDNFSIDLEAVRRRRIVDDPATYYHGQGFYTLKLTTRPPDLKWYKHRRHYSAMFPPNRPALELHTCTEITDIWYFARSRLLFLARVASDEERKTRKAFNETVDAAQDRRFGRSQDGAYNKGTKYTILAFLVCFHEETAKSLGMGRGFNFLPRLTSEELQLAQTVAAYEELIYT